jgi:HD-like signal output (HDOD) protein
MSESTQSPQITQALSAPGLPIPTGIGAELLAYHETTPLSELARLLRADSMLCAALIRLANSAYAQAHRPVLAVDEAVLRFGVAATRQIAIGFSLLTYPWPKLPGLSHGRFWSRALAMAVSSKILVGELRLAPADEVFSVGFLAGMGRLALLCERTREYMRLTEKTKDLPPPKQLEAETEALGCHRGEIAAALLANWQFCPSTAQIVAEYETNDMTRGAPDSRQALLLYTLRCAELLADCITASTVRIAALPMVIRHLPLPPSSLDRIRGVATASWLELTEVLNLPATLPRA